MKIAVLGHTGFIGHTVYAVLKQQNKFAVDGFCSKTKVSDGAVYDVIINCAGVSRIYQTELNPTDSYKIENELLLKLSKFMCPKIIHISSMSFELSNEYGGLKKYVESHIKDLFKEWYILRLSAIIGDGLKKNVVFDFQNDTKIFVTSNTIYNLISSQEVANLISILIEGKNWNRIINVAAFKGIMACDIASIFGKNSVLWGNEFYDYCDIDITELRNFLKPKTSKEYIEEYFCNWIR